MPPTSTRTALRWPVGGRDQLQDRALRSEGSRCRGGSCVGTAGVHRRSALSSAVPSSNQPYSGGRSVVDARYGRRANLATSCRRVTLNPRSGAWLSGRASASHAGGRWFDSIRAHQPSLTPDTPRVRNRWQATLHTLQAGEAPREGHRAGKPAPTSTRLPARRVTLTLACHFVAGFRDARQRCTASTTFSGSIGFRSTQAKSFSSIVEGSAVTTTMGMEARPWATISR